ncbi:(S)-2-haloacid dehalogenase 4A [Deinococcus carri]|uniref:(S)-2-haloacid dehalogenase 4A n=1 Tax=Deinococcus carri TaxID=1211323 RepID=A0ABP9WCH2_9DEIO
MASVVVFDVIETLLDLGSLDPLFGDLFGDPATRQVWFEQTLQNALVSTVVGDYQNFEVLGLSALTMLAEKRGTSVSAAGRLRLEKALLELPAHPDAVPALERLREAGYRLATLTNSLGMASEVELRFAGLRDFFEQALSADDVKRLKPAREPYLYAARQLQVSPARMWLVAAHAWDVTGAAAASCKTAFVGRPGKVLNPAAPRPDVTGENLRDIAEGILAVEALA